MMDSLGEIEVFAEVARTLSFTSAAKSLRMTASGISRSIARLENRLGARLVRRTTRSMSLTDEGAAFRERCERILADVHEAEAAVAGTDQAAKGRVRVDAAMVAAELVLGPLLPGFLREHPELSVELTIRDEPVDALKERLDLVVRLGADAPPGFVARRLGSMRVVTAASPEYLRRAGRPGSPADLRKHECLAVLLDGRPRPWIFGGPGGVITVQPQGRLAAASGFVLRRAALAGLGIVHLYEPFIAEDLAAGALVPLLEPSEAMHSPVFALYPDRKLPPRARTYLEHLTLAFARLAR